MSGRDFQRSVGNPFQAPAASLQEVDAALYGSVDVPVSGRVVSRPIEIMQIRADVRQPRRAVPPVVRLHWDGKANVVPALLDQWQEVAEKRGGIRIDVVAILNGKESLPELDQAPAVTQEFIALARLAQSIHKDGLINPVSVIERSVDFLIETGERRWLAYHLLYQHLGERYKAVPARISDGRDYIWRQAQENTARRQLNAISMARQLALLVMDARRDVDGVKYDEYETLILNGECDRRYYAQVYNGAIHRIPRGMGERIEAAMGLNRSRLSQYRNLLRLTEDEVVNDALWTKADVEDWPERVIRDIAATYPVDVIKEVVKSEDWTLDDLKKAGDMFTMVNISSQKAAGIPANPYSVPAAPKAENHGDMYNQLYISQGMRADKAVSEPSSPHPLTPSSQWRGGTSPETGMARHAPTNGGAVTDTARHAPTMGDGNKSGVIGGRRLLDEGDDRWRLLVALEGLLTMLGDIELANDVKAVRNLTSARIREQRGTILDYLQHVYNGITVKFTDATTSLDGYFAEIEQMLNELSEE